jgi:hypothetical protein
VDGRSAVFSDPVKDIPLIETFFHDTKCAASPSSSLLATAAFVGFNK